MKRLWKRISIFALALAICLTFLPAAPAYAGDSLDEGGPDITASVGGDPVVLSLKGDGIMYDFSTAYTPWDSWKDSIEEVYIGDGITYIGANAFTDMPNLKTVWIPYVDEIHPDAFRNCPNLKLVYFRGYQEGLEALIGGMEAGTAKTILSAATWQCVDKGRTYTFKLSKINEDGIPYLRVTDYKTNVMIDRYLEYLYEKGRFDVMNPQPDWDVDFDFGKDGTPDLHEDFVAAENYYDITYSAIKGGKTGTLATVKGETELNYHLYDQHLPYYGTFKIVIPTKITPSSLSLSTVNYPWTGSYIKPAVTVKVNGKTLKKDTDYTVSYKNNKAIGKATLTVKGKGNYYGTATKRFNIVKAANPMTVATKTKAVLYTTLQKKNVTVKKADVFTVKNNKGKVTFTKASGNSKITVSSAGNITVKKGLKKGTYKVKVKVKAAGTSTYKAKTLTRTITIKVK